MQTLDVYLNDTLVGGLRREGAEISFGYVPNYLGGAKGCCLLFF